MNRAALPGFAAAVALTIGVGAWAATRGQDHFDHLRHRQLFPTCDGCHQIDAAAVTFPDPSLCAACHNGQLAREVDWSGPTPHATNLDFGHVAVLARKREAMGVDFPCQNCHTEPGADRMDVRRIVRERCLGCHAGGQSHHIDAPCTTCHLTLADATELSTEQVRNFPRPDDHTEDFVLRHGAFAEENATRCAVCHARESCSRCHVNAGVVPAIQALQPDARVAAIVSERPVIYPTPSSHLAADWWEIHGARVGPDAASCATCHTSTSCRTCHIDPVPAPIEQLRPKPSDGAAARHDAQAPGVSLTRRRPPYHTPTFADDHRAQAAGATSQCSTCHTQTECASCHTGSENVRQPGRDIGRYHPPNFQQQHSAAAFNREVECATCHNAEAFCRSCHSDLGLGSHGRFDTGFHARKPAWVFGHGQAARQGLESCASCHAQRDCLTCHSALGGRRIRPHGPGFDPQSLRSKSPGMCLLCHRPAILRP